MKKSRIFFGITSLLLGAVSVFATKGSQKFLGAYYQSTDGLGANNGCIATTTPCTKGSLHQCFTSSGVYAIYTSIKPNTNSNTCQNPLKYDVHGF